MAYEIVYNRTEHTSDTPLSIEAYPLLTEDFSVKPSANGQKGASCVLTNMTSPIGSPETVEYQYQEIADVYANTGIDRALCTPSKRGVAFFVKVQETWTARDASDAAAPQYSLPVTATLRVKLPANGLIATADVQTLVKRLITALYPDNSEFMTELVRGSLNPKD